MQTEALHIRGEQKMNRKVIAIPALALAAGLGLSLNACGTTTHTVIVKTAPAVTHTVTAPAPKPTPVKTTPAPAKTVIVQPAPAKTVYVQAPAPPVQHAGNGRIACGSGVYEAGTNCSFAFDVEQAYHAGGYWYQPGTSYLTVDGMPLVSTSVGNPVVVGGPDLTIQFNY
jgi:hypothetical protein